MRRLTQATAGERRDGIRLLLAIVAVMWLVEIVNSLDHQALDRDAGIYARNAGRLWAILTAPFLHFTFGHLIDNTIPFVFMGLIIALDGALRLAKVTAIVVVIGGLGTWLTAPSNSITVGASGIVFGYAAYLLTRGFFNRSVLQLVIGALIAVVWGAALLSSLVPHYGISWQGHAWGAVGGAVAAWLLARPAAARSPAAPGGVPGPPAPRTR